MSTFDGFVKEFPLVRIDFFRSVVGRPPPLACLLSHVHSDHLQGLENLKSPFVYCSPATREILLKLEKWPHRMNFLKGVVECRKQTYKHLKSILKTVPLETATKIELAPGNDIQVTLFNANHCVGAVMFLIEGQGKAVLYTGDTRAEPWLVNSLIQSPSLIPYTVGKRRLDTLYLDTTFGRDCDRYAQFTPKSQGLGQLLEKISSYPPETIFYFHAWTFGYEDVWIALARELKSQIHLDRYRYGLYSSLANTPTGAPIAVEASMICGYQCGNAQHPGIITRHSDPSNVRIHSCERGSGCWIFDMQDPRQSRVVNIVPIVSRENGVEIRELGAGGGRGDMDQVRELELSDPGSKAQLLAKCKETLDVTTVKRIRKFLEGHSLEDWSEPKRIEFSLTQELESDSKTLTIQDTVKIVSELATKPQGSFKNATIGSESSNQTITFPYARHSSFGEMRNMVRVFQPRDVWPCTAPRHWDGQWTMQRLFGDLCSGKERAFDDLMQAQADALSSPQEQRQSTKDKVSQNEDTESEDEDEATHHPEPVRRREVSLLLANEKRMTVSHSRSGKKNHEITVFTPQQRLKRKQEAFQAAKEGCWGTKTRIVSANMSRRFELEEEL